MLAVCLRRRPTFHRVGYYIGSYSKMQIKSDSVCDGMKYVLLFLFYFIYRDGEGRRYTETRVRRRVRGVGSSL